MVARDDVVMGYRFLLGREPENEETVTALSQLGSLAELRDAFIRSDEFQRSLHPPESLPAPVDGAALTVEIKVSEPQLRQMMKIIEANWRALGEAEPYWSVLIHDQYRLQSFADHEEQFYTTGKDFVSTFQQTAERSGVALPRGDCLELGCGVGRVLVWLAEIFDHVTGVDVSRAHLQRAGELFEKYGRANATFVHLNDFAALRALPRFDVFISVIVLQHNPPPLILYMLEVVLDKLRPGGIAYFQVPTYQRHYRFGADEYLAQHVTSGRMEMHLLPQPVLFELFRRQGCELLDIREDGWTGDHSGVSNSIMLRKSQ